MLSILYKLTILILLTALTGCAVNEDPENRFEIFIENDSFNLGMVVPNDDLIVLYNSSQLTYLSGDGELIRQILVPNQDIKNVSTDGESIFVAGRIRNAEDQEISLSSFNLAGENLWEEQLIYETENAESSGLNVINNELILVTVLSENDSAEFSKRVEISVFNREGTESDKSNFEITADYDFNIHNILIIDKDDILLQGQRTIEWGNDGEGIPIFRFKNENLEWFTEIGHPGYQTVTNIIENPSGGFLFVGSKQTISWAFLLDDTGNQLWEVNIGDNNSKNWFYDALFINNEIKFSGYTNSGSDHLEKGVLITTDLNGNIKDEVPYSGQHNKRLISVAQRNSNELLLAGLRLNPGNLFEAWLFNSDLNGEK